MKTRTVGPDGSSIEHEDLCSVEITRNSKGYTWAVKAYGETAETARAEAIATEAKVRAQYGAEVPA